MIKERSIKINFIMNSILSMSSILFSLITFPYIARILGPEGTGMVSFASSIIAYFSIFSQLGIPIYGIRACARVRNDVEKLSQVTAELLTLNLITCVVTYGIFAIALLLIPRLQEKQPLYLILSVSLILNSVGVEWLYKGLERYTYLTAFSLFFKIISICAIFLFVRQPEDYLEFAAITVFSSSGACIVNVINMRHHIQISKCGRLNLMHHLKPVSIFFAMSVATTIYTNLDIAMLGFMKSDLEVGYYSTAVKIKTILMYFVTSLGTVLLPRVSYYLEKGMIDEFHLITKKAINFIILLASPLALYFMLFAKESIYLIAGSKYDGSIAPMILIMPTLLLIGLTNIMGMQILVPMGREKLVMYSTLVGAITDIVINFMLIPSLASSGAAIGTLAAEMIVFFFQLYILRMKAALLYQQIRPLPLFFTLGVCSAISLPIKLLQLGIFSKLLISAIVFFGIYLLLLNLFREPLILEMECQFFKKSRQKDN